MGDEDEAVPAEDPGTRRCAVAHPSVDDVKTLVVDFIAEPDIDKTLPYLQRLLELSTPSDEELHAYRSGKIPSIDTFLFEALVLGNVMTLAVNHIANALIKTESTSVLRVGLEIMRNFSRSERCQSLVARHGAFITWLLRKARDETLDEQAQYLVFGTLNNLVSVPELATRIYATHRIILTVILDYIRSESRLPTNKEWAIAALCNLANAPALRVPIARTPGIVQTLIECYLNDPSEHMAQSVFLGIVGLSSADANHQTLFQNRSLISLMLRMIDPARCDTVPIPQLAGHQTARQLAILSAGNLCRSEVPRVVLVQETPFLSHLSEIVTSPKFKPSEREGVVEALSNVALDRTMGEFLAKDRQLLSALLFLVRGNAVYTGTDSTMVVCCEELLRTIGWPRERVVFAHMAVYLLSARMFPQRNVTAPIGILPLDLIRRIIEVCGWVAEGMLIVA